MGRSYAVEGFLYDGREDKYNLLSALQKSKMIRTRRFTIWPALWKAAQIRRPSEEGFWSSLPKMSDGFSSGGQHCQSLCQAALMTRISRGADQSGAGGYLLSSSPKSNSCITAIDSAIGILRRTKDGRRSRHLMDSHYQGSGENRCGRL